MQYLMMPWNQIFKIGLKMLIFAIKTKQTIKFEPIRNPLEPFLESLRIIHVKKRIRKDWAAASA